jgi:recombination associated protein RdgC
MSPGAAMTTWLSEGDAPAGFTLDRDLELRAPGDERATVRYVRHALEGEEIREHIAEGKSATRLGMTWNDRISFVLTEDLQIKRLAFLDILKEEAEGQAEGREGRDEERFDIDFALMSGELAKLLAALVEALGGEMPESP